jgi:outer membrane protein OmpA-like peptidoglycan-associated protein
MSTRVESESYNPLAEFFEQENQEDESRRGGRAISRYRRGFKSAKGPGRFRPPRVFRRKFPRPFPWRFPFPPAVDPSQQPVDQGTPDVTDPKDGDMNQATDAQQTSGDQEYFEFGAYDRESPNTITLPPIVICGGEPFSSLDNFSFGKSTLRKDATRNHPAQIDAIAREIKKRAARGRPVPSLCIVGRTDVVGAQNFNYKLGLDRARSVKAALCEALGSYADNMTFAVSSLGEMDQTPTGNSPASRGRNRRVDVHLLSEQTDGERCGPAGGRRLPRDMTTFPVASAQREQEFEQAAPARGVRVQPKLCLYQEANNSSQRNHFHHQAQGTARRIGAIGSPNASACNPRIGPTPYSTGADIINAIRAAWQCTGRRPIQSVHIFGHSGSDGLYGNTLDRSGLYQNSISLDPASRSSGGRNISEIPTNILANDVIFVLHGCNQASPCNVQGNDDNFARSLLEHLSGALTNPRVYGHYNSGCAGRNNSWCLYSRTNPRGANSRPDYTDPGGCATNR